jgi:signal transduction histidine kinase
MVVQHEDERRRLARELHDETAQLLSAIKIELGVLRTMVTPAHADRVDDALALTDAGIRSIRAVIQDLRPFLLDDLGLLPALRSVATGFAERAGVALTLSLPTPATMPTLGPDAELALFRAVQEALANIVRHAEAGRVWVSLQVATSHIALTVRDDGLGPEAGTSGGTGIVGIQERFSQLGGHAALTAWPDGGACLDIHLPIATGAAA